MNLPQRSIQGIEVKQWLCRFRGFTRIPSLALAFASVLLLPQSLRGGVIFTNLVTFNCTNGAHARGPLLMAKDGTLYGVTEEGGAGDEVLCSGGGTIFKITTSGDFVTSATLGPGQGGPPTAPLAETGDGAFYGSTYFGGTQMWGTIFRLSSNSITTLCEFDGSKGSNPYGGVVCGADGSVYGSTQWGGEGFWGQDGYGTVFKVSTNGDLTSLHSFDLTDGKHPQGLIKGSDGNLYGTTWSGGMYAGANPSMDFGTVYIISSNDVFTSLVSFVGTNGYWPGPTLANGRDGNLYGTTMLGGPAFDGQSGGYGTVFRITPTGELTTLHEFTGDADGGYPWGQLVLGTDDCFYGTTGSGGTNGQGTFFCISSEGVLTTLYSFAVGHTGGTVNQGADGRFHIVAPNSGPFHNGNIFRLSVPMSPVFQPVEKHGDVLNLTWSSVAEQTYQLQYAADLNSTNWTDLGDTITATNGTTTISDAVKEGKRFYRVVLLP